MILLVHVTIALLSVAYTTYLFISPAKSKFYAAYGLIALTLVSGTYLVLSAHAQMLHACMTGLVYISLVTAGLSAAHRKLIRAEEA